MNTSSYWLKIMNRKSVWIIIPIIANNIKRMGGVLKNKPSLRVIEVPKSRVGPKLVDLYRVDTTPKEAFQQQELLKYSKEYYRKRGMGRPTKKDRRAIEDYIKEEE